MIHHVHADIKGLLKLSNPKLSQLFDRNGESIRDELQERLVKGEKIIPSAGCDNYNQEKGCLGHTTRV